VLLNKPKINKLKAEHLPFKKSRTCIFTFTDKKYFKNQENEEKATAPN
jgi:hypothetical protein